MFAPDTSWGKRIASGCAESSRSGGDHQLLGWIERTAGVRGGHANQATRRLSAHSGALVVLARGLHGRGAGSLRGHTGASPGSCDFRGLYHRGSVDRVGYR